MGWGAAATARVSPARTGARPRALTLACSLALTTAAVIGGYCAWRALTTGDPAWAAVGLSAGAPVIAAYAIRRAPHLWIAIARPRALVAPAAVILAAVTMQGLLASGSFFAGDDWLHLVAGHGASLDLGYVDRPVFIHYAPGLRFGYWALDRLAPLSWPAALAAMLALFAGSLLLVRRICEQLFGPRRWNLVVLLLFGTSVVMVTSFLWFADGMHKLPSTFLSLLAIHAYLRHRLEGSRAALAVSVAAVSLGLLFYVKVALVPLYLVLIRVLWLEPRPRRAPRLLWKERWTWLAFVPPLAIYGWNYLHAYASLAGSRPPLDLIGDYLWVAWFREAAPGLAGIYVGLDRRVLALVIAVAVQALFVALVWVSLRRKRSAWRAWAFWAVAFLANAGLVGFGRLESYGFERVGSDPRYGTEMAWLLPLALAFAFFPGDVAGRPAPPQRPRNRRIAYAGIACYLVLAAVTGTLMARWWRDHETRVPSAYVANLRSDAAALGRRAVVVDKPAPAFIVSARDYPMNRLERVVPAIAPDLRVAAASADPLMVGDDGHIRPAGLYPIGTGAGLLGGSIRLRTGRREGRCLTDGGALRFEPRALPGAQSLYAAITYDVRRESASAARITSPGTPSATGMAPLDRRRGTVLVNLGRPLALTVPASATVCLKGITVGWLG